jgi:hypothetical protein
MKGEKSSLFIRETIAEPPPEHYDLAISQGLRDLVQAPNLEGLTICQGLRDLVQAVSRSKVSETLYIHP